jgi:hypothetical protein
MNRSVTVVTGPAAEPLILGEVKSHLRIDTSDDDALLAAYATAAWEQAEMELRKKLISQTVKLTLDAGRSEADQCLGDGVYELPVTILSGALPRVVSLSYPPVSSITSVVTYGVDGTATTMSAASYFLDSAGGRLALYDSASWPSDIRAVKSCEITYVAGFGSTSAAIPMPIKIGMLQHIKEMYDNRGICDAPSSVSDVYRRYRHYG